MKSLLILVASLAFFVRYVSFAQGGSNGVKKCDMEDPNVGESIIGFKMDINNMQCYHIE